MISNDDSESSNTQRSLSSELMRGQRALLRYERARRSSGERSRARSRKVGRRWRALLWIATIGPFIAVNLLLVVELPSGHDIAPTMDLSAVLAVAMSLWLTLLGVATAVHGLVQQQAMRYWRRNTAEVAPDEWHDSPHHPRAEAIRLAWTGVGITLVGLVYLVLSWIDITRGLWTR
jgi:hypothetical protein